MRPKNNLNERVFYAETHITLILFKRTHYRPNYYQYILRYISTET